MKTPKLTAEKITDILQKSDTPLQVENSQLQLRNSQSQLRKSPLQLRNSPLQVVNSQSQLRNSQSQVVNSQLQNEKTPLQVENSQLQSENIKSQTPEKQPLPIKTEVRATKPIYSLTQKKSTIMKTNSNGRRVPKTLSEFDQYLRRVVGFLLQGNPSNGIRLLLTAAEIAQAQGFLTLWYTGNPANPGAYELHSNPNTKTKNTRKAVIKIISDFSIFFSPLLVRMSGCAAISPSDRLMLNIAAPNPTRTRHRQGISDIVQFSIKPIGGGDVQFSGRTSQDSKRASKAEGADSVQICYKISDPAPVNTDDPTARTESVTHASFTLHLGTVSIGKKLYIYARWYNTKHPELAGPWSQLAQAMIA